MTQIKRSLSVFEKALRVSIVVAQVLSALGMTVLASARVPQLEPLIGAPAPANAAPADAVFDLQESVSATSIPSAKLTMTNWLAPQIVLAGGVLTVTKVVAGSGSGPFSIVVTGPSGVVSSTSIAAGQSLVFSGLASGIYTVTEGAGSYTTQYAVTSGNGVEIGSGVVVTLTAPAAAPVPITPITGRVYVDLNDDGALTVNGTLTEAGLGGVTVTLYDPSGAAVGSAVSGATGYYTITPSGSGPWRVEFTNLPVGYAPGQSGAQNGTSTQFVTTVGGASNVNFGVSALGCQW